MKNYTSPSVPISAWADDDRPREKLQNLGRTALTDAELLAILLRSGSPDESAVSLAIRILQSVDFNLNQLGRQSLSELMKFKGIGLAKAVSIAAALELGRRREASGFIERPVITCSNDIYKAIAPSLADHPHEECWMLLLNKANKLIGKIQISRGGTDATIVDLKIIFRKAVEKQAVAIALCHNHPSGNLRPSSADFALTKKIKKAGELLDIRLLDHIIIGDGGYYSFADENAL
ncbi:MAG TPA: JAB domain-containing protein [Bacteroidetes bacterium]|nr:JAB domain-containing protein [Bacteroidota bacterium]